MSDDVPAQTLILGLGSNVGDSRVLLREAVRAAGEIFTAPPVMSSVYRSPALLPDDAPPEWDIPFLNMAIAGECILSPEVILGRCKAIETALGRQRLGRWAPREIDLDLLAYDTVVISTPALTLPHSDLGLRAFALLPFAEVAPNWRHPVEDWTAWERAEILGTQGCECLGPL